MWAEFWPSLVAKASKSALRPAFGQPEADLEALPFKIQAKTLPTSVFHKNNLLSQESGPATITDSKMCWSQEGTQDAEHKCILIRSHLGSSYLEQASSASCAGRRRPKTPYLN